MAAAQGSHPGRRYYWHCAGSGPAVSEVRYFLEGGQPQSLRIPGNDACQAECRHFIDCVLGKADPGLLSIASACGSLAIVGAATVSVHQHGRAVAL